ncbi:MAG: septum site-determining protein MinC [Rhodocyclaceae bacterium]|nr:septum site-determining protein MinC [Rhodocyclaceae bacterium]
MTNSVSQISLPLPEQSAPAAAPETALEPVPATIDFKGISLPVMQVALTRLAPAQIAAAIKTRFGKNASNFFDNDAAVLDLNKVAEETADWAAVKAQLAAASLQLVAVYGGNEALLAGARAAGLAVIDAPPVSRAAPKVREEVPVLDTVVEATPAAEAKPLPAVPVAAAPTPSMAAAMVIDKPLRSGQRIYARGGDLVVLAMVSAGAEVIADGNIHIYAPLRGRALAGAQGDQKARIFTTSFEAELVSIGGVYRTFESPQAFGKLAGQPVQVSLIADASKPDAEPRLNVAPLSTK